MTRAYYNEHDAGAAEWLRNLIAAGRIAPGDVDTRSIEDVAPTDLVGYTQVHLFAGIGGWSLALRLAGVPDDCPVWTGSCPCQPFSAAGKGAGTADERHLWPAMLWLIRNRLPQRVFGEQVSRAIAHGWIDGVRADLEAEDYACGYTVLGAHSVGAPHIRQRLYWGAVRVADGELSRLEGHAGDGDDRTQPGRLNADTARPVSARSGFGHWDNAVWWPCQDGRMRRVPAVRMDDSRCPRDERRGVAGVVPGETGAVEGVAPERQWGGHADSSAGANGWMADSETTQRRAAEPGLFPLADGVPGGVAVVRPAGCREREEQRIVRRVSALRGAGNAIVPQVAAAFVREFMEATR